MTLFDDEPGPGPAPAPPDAPLPARLRPRSLDEVVGQDHVLGPGTVLRAAFDAGRPPSMVLYGPPGSGKTTIARLAAVSADAAFEELSAVAAGKAEVTAVIARARERRAMGRPTILFLDEIHRFNKAQQDALLPAVEDGTLTLIGATTENPAFEVNAALLSRTRLVDLAPLDAAAVRGLLDRGVAELRADADEDALDFLARRAEGDARVALAALEVAAAEGAVTLDRAGEALGRRAVRYDKKGDQHYDVISAWIKATRASDPDASLYYLAVMLEAGEDVRFIARRMVILASEDVGNADPQALLIATATAHAVDHVGLPECVHNLAQCAIHLSLAPKSKRAYQALGRARAHVREHGAAPPPGYLRTPKVGKVPYDDPHSHPHGLSPQEVMPPGHEGLRFWEPEPELAERLEAIRRGRGRGDETRPRGKGLTP